TTPVPFISGDAYDIHGDEVEYNNKTYIKTTKGLVEDGVYISQKHVMDMKLLLVNGEEKLVYSDSDGVHILNEKTIPYKYEGDTHFNTFIYVADINNSGEDDLLIVYNSTDNHKISVVESFSTDPEDHTDLLFNFRAPADIIGVTQDGGLVFRNGVPCTLTSFSTHPYGISYVVTGNPTSHTDVLSSLQITHQDNNPNIIVFQGLFECTRYFVQVVGENG